MMAELNNNNNMLQNNEAYKREEIHLFDRFYDQKSGIMRAMSFQKHR
jgi:hypothetical protein